MMAYGQAQLEYLSAVSRAQNFATPQHRQHVEEYAEIAMAAARLVVHEEIEALEDRLILQFHTYFNEKAVTDGQLVNDVRNMIVDSFRKAGIDARIGKI